MPHTGLMGARDERVVQAAGGVIVRQTLRGKIQVLLVHRSHREDWTFPKGKLESGESHERCALREVEEETGLRCKLGVELPPSSYINGKGRLKVVRYWIMDPGNDRAEPRNEVDAVRWASLEEAATLLTYSRDREILTAFAAAVG
jgi:8-oxo-dGTP pyrophosphatase MutT (NUDIX family)